MDRFPPFGPPLDSAQIYQGVTDTLRQPDGVDLLPKKYNPRLVAELFAVRFDTYDPAFGGPETRVLGTGIDSSVKVDGLDEHKRLALHQQAYMAGALGMRIVERSLSYNTGTATLHVRLPQKDELPPLPQKNAQGDICNEQGKPIPPAHVDAIYAAHYLADFPHVTSPRPESPRDANGWPILKLDQDGAPIPEKGGLGRLFENVVTQAERADAPGSPGHIIRVRDRRTDPSNPRTPDQQKGALSLFRQVARLMGYQVGTFQLNNGYFEMQVGRPTAGFDSKSTHFKKPEGDHWDKDRPISTETHAYRPAAPVISIGEWVHIDEVPEDSQAA